MHWQGSAQEGTQATWAMSSSITQCIRDGMGWNQGSPGSTYAVSYSEAGVAAPDPQTASSRARIALLLEFESDLR